MYTVNSRSSPPFPQTLGKGLLFPSSQAVVLLISSPEAMASAEDRGSGFAGEAAPNSHAEWCIFIKFVLTSVVICCFYNKMLRGFPPAQNLRVHGKALWRGKTRVYRKR